MHFVEMHYINALLIKIFMPIFISSDIYLQINIVYLYACMYIIYIMYIIHI